MSEARRTKFDERREATHRELLALGVERFPVKGYAATSIDDIMRDTRHSKGGFYHHFGSKEEFFLDVMRTRGALMADAWGSLAGPFGSLEEGLAAAGVWLETDTMALPDMLLLSEFRFAVRDKPDMLGAVAVLFDDWMAHLRRLVDVLAASGLVRADRTARELSESVYHLTDGYVVHAAIFGSSMQGLRGDLVRLLRP